MLIKLTYSMTDKHFILKEIKNKIDEMPIHIYNLIWVVTDMILKNGTNFNKINYPYTTIPVFSEFEAGNLEQLWNLNIKNNLKIFSEDVLQESDFDSIEYSRNVDVIAIETYNEITVKPLYANHEKIIIPIINSVLEALRIINLTDYNSTLINIVSELSKGNMYSVVLLILTKLPDNKFTNLLIRILRNSILLSPPEIRVNFKDIYYKPPPYFLSDFSIWIFVLLSPKFVKDSLNNLISEKNSDLPSINDLIVALKSAKQPESDELRSIPPFALFFEFKIVKQDTNKITNKRVTFKNKRQQVIDK